MKIARYVKASVHTGRIVRDDTRLVFQYKGTEFAVYVSSHEYDAYRNELIIENENT